MKFAVLAALFAAALAADMQLTLQWGCQFHINLTKNNVFGWHDLHGMMGENSMMYLRDEVYSSTNYTRIFRYDVKSNNYMPYLQNSSTGCSFDHTNEWVDWDTALFKKSFVYNRDPSAVVCPVEIPELAQHTCKQYCYETYYYSNCIIVDDSSHVAWWNRDGGWYFHWLNGTIPVSEFEIHYCDKDVVLTAPPTCDAASMASVAKLLLAAVLLIALL